MKPELALSLTLLLSPVVCNAQQDAPFTLPAGYRWGDCNNIVASFPTPEGWHIKEETKGETRACFITLEEITAGGIYSTGLAINTIPNTSAKMGRKPSEIAQDYARKANGGNNQEVEERTLGDFKSFKAKSATLKFPQLGRSMTMQTTAIANDRKNITYILTFEAPESEGNKAQQIGEMMIQRAKLDQTFSGTR